MDFFLGEIEEIEHLLNLVNPCNPNVDLVKINCTLITHQFVVVVVSIRDSLLEQSKVNGPRETSTSQQSKNLST